MSGIISNEEKLLNDLRFLDQDSSIHPYAREVWHQSALRNFIYVVLERLDKIEKMIAASDEERE